MFLSAACATPHSGHTQWQLEALHEERTWL